MLSKSFQFPFSKFLNVFSFFIVVMFFSALPAGAVTINEFAVPTDSCVPYGIAAGPDGNLWFTERSGLNIGRITTAGVITEFPLPAAHEALNSITAGPDGNLWFTETWPSGIGRITTDGVITEFPLPVANDDPGGITAGPDGNLWFTESFPSGIGRITTDGVITEFPLPFVGYPGDISAGPDGNLWFAVTPTMPSGSSYIGRITTAGVITKLTLPMAGGAPMGITSGPDGNLWFTVQSSSEAGNSNIGRITTGGVITEFPLNGISYPGGITTGPDGNLWFTEAYDSLIGKITTAGVITEFSVPLMPGVLSESPSQITAGSDGNMWFTIAPGQIGQLVLDDVLKIEAPTPATTFTAVYPGPADQSGYFSDMTSKNSDLSKAVPLWMWEEGPAAPSYTVNPADPVRVTLNLGYYLEPVDVYAGLQIPGFSGDIYLFGQDGGLHSLSAEGLVKYRSSVLSVKTDILTTTESVIADLKNAYPGTWYFYTLVVPAGNVDNGIVDSYYLWKTSY